MENTLENNMNNNDDGDSKDYILKLHPHPIGFLGFYTLGTVFVIAGLVFLQYWEMIALGIIIFYFGEVFRKATTYYVLENGVAKEYKFLSSYKKFAECSKIQDMDISQSVLERILGIGTIDFDTSGGDEIEVSFQNVLDPYGIEKIVRSEMNR